MRAFALSMTLEPISARNEEEAVEAFGKALRITKPHAKLIAADGNELPIPEAIYKVLEQVIPLLVSENAVSIVPVGTLLTTQQAADLLNVSRPHLIKLLNQGAINFERSNEPGSHRKIRFVDLMEYKHKLSIERRKQLRKLTEMSQKAGFYEE
jgi:excisionase family DNA binding protein